jgi:hypothetical protein
MYQDFKDLLSAFHAHGVKYLIVGGYAVIFHAQPRTTKDIDLLIQAEPANAQATYGALKEFGMPLGDIALRILPSAVTSSASDTSRVVSTSCPTFRAWTLSRLGSGASRE